MRRNLPDLNMKLLALSLTRQMFADQAGQLICKPQCQDDQQHLQELAQYNLLGYPGP